jgi:DNA (cytosine-5)-methyltransferase 1
VTRTFYEFFAGGGMVRAGLGDNWECLFANDNDVKKAASYAANWGSVHFKLGDVGALTNADLPGRASLAWASFPCQDLSLAGDYVGLRGKRSGTFWPFWRLVRALADEGRAASLIVLENVCGALTSHDGKDFVAIGEALAGAGYRFSTLVMDAARFVPQSRPRIFVVGVYGGLVVPDRLTMTQAGSPWHPASLAYSERWRSAFRGDGDHDSELMPIAIPR